MIRLCVLGNSHVAALKLAWDDVRAEHPDFELTFFAARGEGLSRLKINARRDRLKSHNKLLVGSLAMTSGGPTEIVVRDYDAFLLCGLGFGVRSAVRLYRQVRTEEQAPITGPQQLVSANCFREALTLALSGTLAVRLATKLREITAAPMLVLAEPLPSELVLASAVEGADTWRELRDTGDGAALWTLSRELSAAVLFPGLRQVQQPVETRAGESLTRAEYSVGSVRLKAGFPEHPEDDIGHMNRAYGAACLERVLEACALDVSSR